MKICPECSKENLDDAKFCTGCGFDLTDVESKADVTVSVINEATGRPVGNATVIIYNDKSKASLKGTTGVVGDCTIKNVPYGEYTISAEADRYKTGSNSVTINAEDVFEEINIKEKTSKSKLKIIGVLLIIIILLGVGLFVTSNMNQLISDSSVSDANAVDQQITSNNVDDDNTHFQTVDFNGLFRMNVNESSTFHEVPPDTDWYVSKQWNNDINNTGYAFDGYNTVIYWKNTNLSEVVSNLSTIYHNPKYEGDIVILECYSKTSEPAYYDYLVGTQSDDNEVVLIMGSDLDLLKTYANSIVFE